MVHAQIIPIGVIHTLCVCVCVSVCVCVCSDKGILMTFGSGANGSLGHGDYSDVKEVHTYIHVHAWVT